MECLNPLDPQTMRIFSEDGAFHAVMANTGGGHGAGRNPPVCFAQNTRDEVRIVGGGICGALAAEPGMKQQNYIMEGIGKCHSS